MISTKLAGTGITAQEQERFSPKLAHIINLLFKEEDPNFCEKLLGILLECPPPLEKLKPLMCSLLAHQEDQIRSRAAVFLTENFAGQPEFGVLFYCAWKKEKNPDIAEVIKQGFLKTAPTISWKLEEDRNKLRYSSFAKRSEFLNSDEIHFPLIALHFDTDQVSLINAAAKLCKIATHHGDEVSDTFLCHSAYLLSDTSGRYSMFKSGILNLFEIRKELAVELEPILQKLQHDQNGLISLKSALIRLTVLKSSDPDVLETVLNSLTYREDDVVEQLSSAPSKSDFKSWDYEVNVLASIHSMVEEMKKLEIEPDLYPLEKIYDSFLDARAKVERASVESERRAEQLYTKTISSINISVGFSIICSAVLDSLDKMPESARAAVRSRLYAEISRETRPEARQSLLRGMSFIYADDTQDDVKLRQFLKDEKDAQVRKRIESTLDSFERIRRMVDDAKAQLAAS